MNIQQAAAILPVLQAYVEGMSVQYRQSPNHAWCSTARPDFSPIFEWRVKPEPRHFRLKYDSQDGWQVTEACKWVNPPDDRNLNLDIKVQEIV